MKCSESLSNWVSKIIRRYIDHMEFAACMDFSFNTFFPILLVPFYHCTCICGCMFVCFYLIL